MTDRTCPQCGGTIITTPTKVASSVGTGASGLSTSPPTYGPSCSILTVTRTWLDDDSDGGSSAHPWHGWTAREACNSRYRRLRDVGHPASIRVDATTLKISMHVGEFALVETLHWADVEGAA